MKSSRSLDVITKQFMAHAQMDDLSPNDRKFILNHFKKLYSQQMSKAMVDISRINKVKNNKNQIQQKQQNQIKAINQNIIKKMSQHNEKREKAFISKINHFKLLDENWKIKMESIQRKKNQENRQSLQKALRYRKQAQSFFHQNRRKNKSESTDHKNNMVASEATLTIKEQILTHQSNQPKKVRFQLNRGKSHSKNEFPNVNRTYLPTIDKKSFNQVALKKKKSNCRTFMYKSLNKFVDAKTIQEHIQKSKNISSEKQESALNKVLQKMRLIQEKRKKCKFDRQKTLEQAKSKRQLRQQAFAYRQKIQQSLQTRTPKQKRTQNLANQQYAKMMQSRSKSRNQDSISLNESIIRHKQAKQQLEEQEFIERGEMYKANMLKLKKGKMLRMVKDTIKKMRKQALNQT